MVQFNGLRAFDGLGILFILMKDLQAYLEEEELLCNECTCIMLLTCLPGGGRAIGAGAGDGGDAAVGRGEVVASKISSSLMLLAPPPSFSAVSITSHFFCSSACTFCA